MAEELKSGGSSNSDVMAEPEEEGSRGGGGALRASRSGPPSVPFPLLSKRELLQQHVDTQLQQLEAGEIRELSLQTMWTMDVLASTLSHCHLCLLVLLYSVSAAYLLLLLYCYTRSL